MSFQSFKVNLWRLSRDRKRGRWGCELVWRTNLRAPSQIADNCMAGTPYKNNRQRAKIATIWSVGELEKTDLGLWGLVKEGDICVNVAEMRGSFFVYPQCGLNQHYRPREEVIFFLLEIILKVNEH